MNYDNLDLASLRELRSMKWSNVQSDQIPMWVAEMDFPVASAITDGISEFLLQGGAGYPSPAIIESQQSALIDWYGASTGVSLSMDRLIEVPSVLTSLEILVRQRIPEDAAVIVPVPAYMPFLTILKWLGRRIITVPMIAPQEPGEAYRYDLPGIDRAFQEGGKLLLLCNPHNPTGALLANDEALALGTIVDAHNGLVFSDEIHLPVRFADSPPFVSYGSLNEVHLAHTYTAVSASKGWNIPGLKCATVITPSPEAVNQFATAMPEASSVGLLAADRAYSQARGWSSDTNAYIRKNIERFADFFAQVRPDIRFTAPQATYLAWVDLSSLRPEAPESVAAYLADEARVVASNGADCGAPGYVRFNLATSRPVLDEALLRLERVLVH